MKINIIVAYDLHKGIGTQNKLMWHLSADLKRFKTITSKHWILMGRKTYESIGRPLPNRTNVVITRNAHYQADGCKVVESVEKALEMAQQEGEKEIFIIGGGEIYKQMIGQADTLYVTEVQAIFEEADTFFPSFDITQWRIISQETHQKDEKNSFAYTFIHYQNTHKSSLQN